MGCANPEKVMELSQTMRDLSRPVPLPETPRMTRSEHARVHNSMRSGTHQSRMAEACDKVLLEKKMLAKELSKQKEEVISLEAECNSLMKNKRIATLARVRAHRQRKAAKLALSPEAEGDAALATKFICMMSLRQLAGQRRLSARSRGKRCSKGLSSKGNVAASMKRAKKVLVSRGFELLGKVADLDPTAEGIVRNPHDILMELLDLHAGQLNGKCIDQDHISNDEIRTGLRLGTDGFPQTEVDPAHCQLMSMFELFARDSTALVFVRLIMHSAHPEDHTATRKGTCWATGKTSNMAKLSSAGKLLWRGKRVTTLGTVPTVDWAMNVKLLACQSPSSVFCGCMLRLTKHDWKTLLGISREGLKALMTTPDVREELATEMEFMLALHREKWKKANPRATAEQWDKEAKKQIDACGCIHKNPQVGRPLEIVRFALHCALHAKLRMAARQAKILCNLDEDCIAELTSNAKFKKLGHDMKKEKSSTNMNGKQASALFREHPTIAAAKLDDQKSLRNFLILCHVQIMISTRDIIGKVMATHDWSEPDLEELSRIGRQTFNLMLLVFGKLRMQPCVHAILIELPLQIELCVQFCKSNKLKADTSALNAQCSEHVNKVLKDLEHKISFHVRKTHGDSDDVNSHTESRCFLPFTCEHFTKEVALLMDLRTEKEMLESRKTEMNNILPEGGDVCKRCGAHTSSGAHRLVCNHGWMTIIHKMMEEAKTPPVLSNLLKSPEAQGLLLAENNEESAARAPRVRVVNVSEEQKVSKVAKPNMRSPSLLRARRGSGGPECSMWSRGTTRMSRDRSVMRAGSAELEDAAMVCFCPTK